MELLKVIYVGRHGEREPVFVPDALKEDWTSGNQITLKGAKGQYAKGVQLRTKYSEFFKQLDDSPKHIFCRVSDFDRIIDSGYCLLSGILNLPFTPPSEDKKYHLLSKYSCLLNKAACTALYRGHFKGSSPNLIPIYTSLHKAAEERKERFTDLQPLVPKLAKLYALNPVIMDYRGFYHFYDFLECYRANDKPLPKGFDKSDMEAMKFIIKYTMYDLTFVNEILRRVYNHYIYKELIKVMEGSKPMFYYFSGHDVTLFCILLGLGYELDELAEYNTGLTIEVYKGAGEKFVNVEYAGKNMNKLLFPGMSTDYIPIEKLLNVMRKECFKSDEEYKLHTGNTHFDYERDYTEPEVLKD